MVNGAWRSRSGSFVVSRWKREIFSAAPSGRKLKLQGTNRKKDNLLFLSLQPLFSFPPPTPPTLQTKDALLSILNDLRPADRFNLVGFSNKVKVWQPSRLLPVTPLNIRDAKKFIFTLPTTGGQRSPVHLSIRLPVQISICLSIYYPVCPSIHLPVLLSTCLSSCPSVHLSVCPSIIHLSVRLSVRPFVCAICLAVHSFLHLSICLSFCLSVLVPVHPYICLSL